MKTRPRFFLGEDLIDYSIHLKKHRFNVSYRLRTIGRFTSAALSYYFSGPQNLQGFRIPDIFINLVLPSAGVAQLARAPAFQAGSCGFKSHRPLFLCLLHYLQPDGVMTSGTDTNGSEKSSDGEGTPQTSSPPDREEGFKQKLEQIDEILEELQGGELELEESLELYETSIGLLRECKEILNQSEEKIERLKMEGEEILTEPFDPETDEGEPADED